MRAYAAVAAEQSRATRESQARRLLRSAAAAGEPAPAAERTASTSASGGRGVCSAADRRSGKARGWVGEEARSARREEARSSATAGPRAARGLANRGEKGWAAHCCGGEGEGDAAEEVVAAASVHRRRRGSGGEAAAARSRDGRMVARKGFQGSMESQERSQVSS
jgi:hypothetical protein